MKARKNVFLSFVRERIAGHRSASSVISSCTSIDSPFDTCAYTRMLLASSMLFCGPRIFLRIRSKSTLIWSFPSLIFVIVAIYSSLKISRRNCADLYDTPKKLSLEDASFSSNKSCLNPLWVARLLIRFDSFKRNGG